MPLSIRKSAISRGQDASSPRSVPRAVDWSLWVGGGLVAIILGLGFIGPLLLRNPNAMSSYYLVAPMVHGFLLGTDQFGRSELTRIVWGIRTSLEISFVAISGAFIVGTIVGLLSARFPLVDMLAMRVMDVFLAFPAMLMAIGIMAMVGPGRVGVIEAITVVYIPIFARVSRGPAMEQLTKEYVEAEYALGASTARVLLRHVFPNIWPFIVVQLSLAISDAILIEAALSYLGLGVVPPAASLGALLESGQSLMFSAPWTAVFPGVAIALAVLGFNMLGDALRDKSSVRVK